MKHFFTILLLFILPFLYGQYPENNTILEDFAIENIEEFESSNYNDVELSNWMEFSSDILGRKFNINNLDRDVAIFKLDFTEFQFYHLCKYISDYGELVSWTELRTIEGFKDEFIQKIIPYLYLGASDKNRKIALWKNWKHQLKFYYGQILEEKEGYNIENNNSYKGTPQQYKMNYLLKNEHFSFGFSGTKNPTEQFFKGEQKYGFGFYSAHLQIKNIGILKSLILGDYRLSFGQGGGVGNVFSLNNTFVSHKRDYILRPAIATSDNYLMRGAAIQLGNYQYHATLFYHHALDCSSRNFGIYFSTLQKNWKLGGSFLIHNIERYIDYNYTIDYQYNIKHCILYGEVGLFNKNGWMGIQGATFNWNTRITSGVFVRYYHKNYNATLGNSYSKGSELNNELGALLSHQIAISKMVSIGIISEITWLNKPAHLIEKPSLRVETKAKVDVNINRNHHLLLLYHHKYYESNLSKSLYYKEIKEINSHKFRVNYKSTVRKNLQMRTEIQINYNKTLGEEKGKWGALFYNDFIYKLTKLRLTLKQRIALFNTDSYDERCYAYEDDVSQVFNIGNYYYKGIKAYFVLQYKWKILTFEGKIGRTVFTDRNTIGDGKEKINSNTKTEVKMQIILKL